MEKKVVSFTLALLLAAILAPAYPAMGGSVSYEYDPLGRLERIVYDDGTVIDFVYDAAGNRTSRVVTPGT